MKYAKKEKVEWHGYLMTERQGCELADLLVDNILKRYNNDEYHDPEIIKEFAKNNKLKKI